MLTSVFLFFFPPRYMIGRVCDLRVGAKVGPTVGPPGFGAGVGC